MPDGKKYYWLKLKADFFSSKRIKKLRKMAGGDTYTIIYLKMQLASIKTDGVLQWTGLEDNFAAELALDLDESVEDVQMTLLFLQANGLIETSDNVNYFLPYAVENTGTETSAAERMRKMRARQTEEKLLKDAERNGVTPLLHPCYTEIEKEKEIKKELELDPCRPDVQQVVDAWNSLGLQKVTRIVTDSQRGKWLKKRISDYGLSEVLRAIDMIRISSFLQGKNSNGWQITFDWFVRPNNFPKVLEGNYTDKMPSGYDTNNIFLQMMEDERDKQ